MTIPAGPFGHFHLITVGMPVSHDIFPGVAIDAPKASFGMNIFGQMVVIQPVAPGFRLSLDQRGAEIIAVLMLKKPFIISTHVVLVMTVKALLIGDLPGPGVSDWIPGFGF